MKRKPLILSLAAAGGVRDQPRHDDRQRRAADARARAARVQLAAPVGRGRVQPGVRGIGAGGGQPLGPVRAQGNAARRPVGVRAGEPGRRADQQPRRADRGPRGDGRGRGDGVPVDAVAAHKRVHRAPRARAGDRSVGRDHRRRDRARADRRRLAARRSSTGAASSSRWLRSPRSPACSSPATFRPRAIRARRRTDRAGFALSTATIGLLVYTIIEAPNHGWGSARTLGELRADRGPGGRVRDLGAAHRASRCST